MEIAILTIAILVIALSYIFFMGVLIGRNHEQILEWWRKNTIINWLNGTD